MISLLPTPGPLRSRSLSRLASNAYLAMYQEQGRDSRARHGHVCLPPLSIFCIKRLGSREYFIWLHFGWTNKVENPELGCGVCGYTDASQKSPLGRWTGTVSCAYILPQYFRDTQSRVFWVHLLEETTTREKNERKCTFSLVRDDGVNIQDLGQEYFGTIFSHTHSRIMSLASRCIQSYLTSTPNRTRKRLDAMCCVTVSHSFLVFLYSITRKERWRSFELCASADGDTDGRTDSNRELKFSISLSLSFSLSPPFAREIWSKKKVNAQCVHSLG